MPKQITAPCGATRSKSSNRPFTYASLTDHIALCPACRKKNGVTTALVGPRTLQAEAEEQVAELAQHDHA